MNVLFLSQGKDIDTHPDWHDALVRLREEAFIRDFLNVPFYGYAEKHGWDNFYKHVVDLCRQDKYDIVYFHYFHSQAIPSPQKCIESIRGVAPSSVIMTSSGDPFSDNWMRNHYPQSIKNASRYADITFSTQMGRAADKMLRWGANNIVFTPNSLCQTRFEAKGIDWENHKFDFDVVFVGSRNAVRFNPISKHYFATRHRRKLVAALSRHFGKRFGLFGNGWDGVLPNEGPIPFNQQQDYFRRGRIVVGGNPYSYSDYYSSNRIFFEVGSGIPTVELKVQRLDNVLRDNDHVYFANDIDDVIEKCEQILKSDAKQVYSKAAKAAQYIAERHTQYHRMKFKIDTAMRYLANGRKLDVKFPFFLDEVDLEQEMKYAIRAK